MSKKDRQYEYCRNILEQSYDSFRMPTPMSTFDANDIRQFARLLWAMQTVMKNVLDQLDTLGDTTVLMERIARVERLMVYARGIIPSEQACELLGVKKSQLYKLIRTKALPAYKPSGKMIYLEIEECQKWSRQNPKRRGTRPIDHMGTFENEPANDEE